MNSYIIELSHAIDEFYNVNLSLIYSFDGEEKLEYNISLGGLGDKLPEIMVPPGKKFELKNSVLTFDIKADEQDIDELISVYCGYAGLCKEGSLVTE